MPINEERSLAKIQEFLNVLQTAESMQSNSRGNYSYLDLPAYKSAKEQIHEHLPLIKRIASVLDPGLYEPLQDGLAGGQYHGAITVTQQLAGTLKSAKEAEEILGDHGPKMAADDLCTDGFGRRQPRGGVPVSSGMPSRARQPAFLMSSFPGS